MMATMIVAVFCLSSFVIIEPAPFDLVFIGLALAALFRAHPVLHRDLLLPATVLCVFALSNAISGMFAIDIPLMMMFMAVTFFLILVAVIVFALVATWPDAAHAVLIGYCISSLISTVITLAVFAGLLPFDFVMFDASRVQAFFKDPNVYGPSLVVSILYLVALLEYRPRWRAGIIVALPILVLGVVFSASRAAWMNLALSLTLYLGLRAWESRDHGLGRYWIMAAGVLLLVAGGSIAVAMLTDYGEFINERTAMQDYDADRFAAQHEGIELAFEDPFGLGPGQFEPRVGVLGISAHSLYVRTLLENGLAGLVSLFVFLGLTLLVAFRSALSGGPLAACGAVVAASLVGVLLNSVVVDTLHWRSLWIQAGLAWGLYVACLQHWPARPARPAGSVVPGSTTASAPLSRPWIFDDKS
jgi:O-antigen ligase